MKSMLAQLTSIEGLTRIEGIASDVRQTRSTVISNGAPGDSSYECLFRLSGRPVDLLVDGPVFIEEGETISVVGVRNQDGVFEASAYYNQSSRVSGRSSWPRTQYTAITLAVVGGVVAFVIVLFGLGTSDMPYASDYWQSSGLLFLWLVLGASVLMLYGLIMFVRCRIKIRTIERLLNGV